MSAIRSFIIAILVYHEMNFDRLFSLGASVCRTSLLPQGASYTDKVYKEGSLNWINPGRGFYHKLMMSSKHDEFDSIKGSTLDCWRIRDGTSLLLRLYRLDTSVDGSDLSLDFLHNLRHDMETVHQAGWNVVLRFTYNTNTNLTYNTHNGEPSIDRIKAHVVQLSPIFHEYEGIIVAIQAGFLGELGLWYDPGNVNNEPSQATYSQLLDVLFNSVPKSITIQVSKPVFKQSYLSPSPTTELDVFTSSNKLRIGHFHECLLGSNVNHLLNAFPHLTTTTTTSNDAAPYLLADTKFTVMGGRTCHPGNTNTTANLCADSISLFEKIHMSYLDIDDPYEALKYYQHHHCFDTIHERLGYQLFLDTVTLPTAAVTGDDMCFHISLKNKGFSTPFRNVDVFIVFQLNSTMKDHTSRVYRLDLSINTSLDKLWQPSLQQISLVTKITRLPGNMPPGIYKVYLAMADPKWQNESNYYILLGGVYNGQPAADPTTGLNLLGQVQIFPGTLNASVSLLRQWDLPLPTKHIRQWAGRGTQSCIALPPCKPTGSPGSTDIPGSNQFDRYATCNKIDVTNALLRDDYVNSSLAFPCPNTNPHSSEAILQRFCHAPVASRWRPLNNGRVIDHCDDIPKFTPVAFFKTLLGVSSYDRSLYGGTSGVFFGCVRSNGVLKSIKIGIQLCGYHFDVTLIHDHDIDLQNLFIVNLV